jgi:hypothetical protein
VAPAIALELACFFLVLSETVLAFKRDLEPRLLARISTTSATLPFEYEYDENQQRQF